MGKARVLAGEGESVTGAGTGAGRGDAAAVSPRAAF